jgi:hypothetical protein
VCGLFRITWAYWSDSGKPTLGGESTDTQTGKVFHIDMFNKNSLIFFFVIPAYSNCVNDPICAATSVQGYMNKFGQVSINF